MEQMIQHAAAVGVLVTLLCTASITEKVRDFARTKHVTVLDCPYCTSFWVSFVVDPSPTYFVTVLTGNIAIMLIHWSMATYQTEGQ